MPYNVKLQLFLIISLILFTIVPVFGQGTFYPVPTANSSFWQQNIPQHIRNGYIKAALRYSGNEWKKIAPELFSEYKRTGNRKNYEVQYYIPRRQLANLVMGEIMEHRGRFLPDISLGLSYFINETWWGLPAHYPDSLPKASNQIVDLFNAETANLLSWTIYMLHDDIETNSKGLCETIRKEIERRMLIPVLNNNYWWKTSNSNWNTWICSNWLSSALFCEVDDTRRQAAINQIMLCLSSFFYSYPEDGGCEEGISYWDRAGGSFADCIELLSKAGINQHFTNHRPKFQNIGSFIYKMCISPNTYISFSDATGNTWPDSNLLYRYGVYAQDSTITQFARWLADESGSTPKPYYRFSLTEFPSLSRELLFLCSYNDFQKTKPRQSLIRDTWFPNLQVFAARLENGSTKGLFVAAKGGHNAENHNHNDVGNFIVYYDAKPVLIDIGSGTYTAQTFSNDRYELFNCRSAYHNVPIINGFEQHEGKEYKATDVEHSQNNNQGRLTLDISKAYPKEACIKKWQRTICLNRNKDITITEKYLLSKYIEPSAITLISCGETKKENNGIISVDTGSHILHISYDDNTFSADIAEVKHNDPLIKGQWNNKTLYQIRLTIRSHKLKGKVSYRIL